MDYLLPSIHEVPVIADVEHCTPSPYTTLGQKGAGEAGYMGAPAAVASAVNDALTATGAPAVTPCRSERALSGRSCPATPPPPVTHQRSPTHHDQPIPGRRLH